MPQSSPLPEPAFDELTTIRDWLRYGVSAFSRAKLVYGHGTSSALDEAAFLILMALHLPIDSLEPWLDARLTSPERAAVRDVLQARITTRKPAAYLVNAAFIQGNRFYVDERVIVPRSYIGELLCSDQLSSVVADPDRVTRVLDLCTGSGCLAILAALSYPNAHVDALDISADALAVAAKNVADYELAERVSLIQSDLLASLPKDAHYDLIIANPPYVAQAEVAAFAPEYCAEPQLAHLGGSDGLDLVHRILQGAGAYLTPGGMLVMEIGTGAHVLETAYPNLEVLWLDTAESQGELLAVARKPLESLRRETAQKLVV